jgi:hypothetical protein
MKPVVSPMPPSLRILAGRRPAARSLPARPLGARLLAALSAAGFLLCACIVAATQGVPSAHAQPAAADPKAPAAPARPQVLLPGAGDAGQDLAITLPPWPEERDLSELNQRVRPDLRFFIDRRSIELVPGGEFRYTFVVRSAAGISNVTFETLRCEPRERMMLAIGSPERRWSPARLMRWESLTRNDPTGMREVLYRDIFCPDRQPVATLKEVLKALQSGLSAREPGGH